MTIAQLTTNSHLHETLAKSASDCVETGDNSSSDLVGSATIMVVDDEPINIRVVRKYLQNAGFQRFITTTESTEALRMIRTERPDVVVLDVMMPQVSGLEILAEMQHDSGPRDIPVLILTASDDSETKLKALQLGATDFLRKPVDPSELCLRINNMLIVKAHRDQLADQSSKLELEVRQRTMELEQSRQELMHVLACAAEYRDQETGNHVIRVGRFAGIIARELGLNDENATLIEQAAVLHDVGKIGIPDSILLKPGKLNDTEIAEMQNHCEYGLNILMGVPCQTRDNVRETVGPRRLTQSPILRTAATITMSHHEKWDGSGYPLGLSGEAIPIEGRITAVADVFDALSSDRPYKRAMPWNKCCEILEEGRGKHFDPAVLDAFFTRAADIQTVQLKYTDVV